jgi:pimeloyl-ACP methyl ester carboxylesterase
VRPRIALSLLAGGAAALAALKLVDARDQAEDADGLSVRRFGDTGPSVLCLHGLFGSGAFWSPLARQLASGHRLAVPDLMGFGRSAKPVADYTIDFHLSWLAPLVEERHDWTVAGHSMGCALAIHLGRRWPKRVSRTILFSAPVYASPERRRDVFAQQALLSRVSTRSRTAGRLICEASCLLRPVVSRLAPWIRPDRPPEMVRDYFRHTWNAYDTSFRHLVVERDLLSDMATLDHPVLVIQGGQDRVVDAADRLPWPPNVIVRVVPDADHTSLLLDRPQEAARFVREFKGPLEN